MHGPQEHAQFAHRDLDKVGCWLLPASGCVVVEGLSFLLAKSDPLFLCRSLLSEFYLFSSDAKTCTCFTSSSSALFFLIKTEQSLVFHTLLAILLLLARAYQFDELDDGLAVLVIFDWLFLCRFILGPGACGRCSSFTVLCRRRPGSQTFSFPRMAITHQNCPHVPRAFHRFGRDLATWSPPTLITACYESWTSNLHKVMVPFSPGGFGFRSLSSLAAAKIENGLSLSVVISPPPEGLL